MKRTIVSARVLLCSTAFLALAAGESAAAPLIGSIAPSSGPTAGNFPITISGIDFSASGNSVTLDGDECHISTETTNQIICEVPEGTGAANEVQVVDDTGAPSNTRNFSYDAPSISSITPSSGPQLGGTRITIQGLNFGPSSADSVRSVLVGATGESCTLVPGVASHTEIQCVTPAGTGSSDVMVAVDGQISNAQPFDYVPPPSLSSISPSSADTIGGSTLTIYGSDFKASGNTATVGGRSCPATLESPTQIQCTLPEGLGADLEVEVTADGQTGGDQYFDYNPPLISSITPDHGPTEGNVPITIQGSNFGPASADAQRSVVVGTSACPLVASSSGHSSIICTLPPGQGVSRIVEVVAGDQPSNTAALSYDPPAITSVSPTRASASGGTLLTITGSNFGLTAAVTVDGETCPLTMQSHTELRCTGPASPPNDAAVVAVSVSGQLDLFPIDYEEAACQNGIVDIQKGEVCDDGNNSSGDGCSADCRSEQPQTDEQAGCIAAMNKSGAKVFAASGKEALACAKKDAPAPCVGALSSNGLAAALDKVDTTSSKKCPETPDFGSSTVTVIKGGNRDRPVDLMIDIFGPDPDAALAPDGSAPNRAACQDDVLKAELKYASARLKAFTKCKKAGLEDRDAPIITDSALAACLEVADNDPSVAKPAQAQFASMIDSCVNLSEDRALAFPGVCATAPDTAACLEDRVRCRTCQAIRSTDALEDVLDCDDDDDGLDNESCD
jgi:cysteine-rich repeat protein